MNAPVQPTAPDQIGANADPSNLLTNLTSSLQTVGGSDIVFASAAGTVFSQLTTQPVFVRRVCCQGTGTIGIKRFWDTAFTSYTVAAGAYIDGNIIAVGSTSNGSSSGMTFIAEI
jgi:hypothetical protein